MGPASEYCRQTSNLLLIACHGVWMLLYWINYYGAGVIIEQDMSFKQISRTVFSSARVMLKNALLLGWTTVIPVLKAP